MKKLNAIHLPCLKGLVVTALLCAFVQAARADEITWTEVGTEEALVSAIQDGAHIRLADNILLSAHLKIGQSSNQTVAIDLNGHTLRRNLSSASSDGHVIEVYENGTLTVTDGATGGTITGGWANNGGGICNYGTLYFQGGTITECKTANEAGCMGGGIKNNIGGTVTMSGGTITRCESGDCGGIYNGEGATLNVTGGTISDCKSGAGGGGIVNYGTATLSRLTLSGNTAGTRGGNIWNKGLLTINDCEIKDGQSIIEAGGLYLNGGTATLTSVKVNDNESKDGGGIYVSSGATLNLGGNSQITGNSSTEHGGGGITNHGTLNITGILNMAGNTCKTNGGGIWSEGTLKMGPDDMTILIKDNTTESGLEQNVFLKSGKKITVAGDFNEASDIGVTLESTVGTFTSGYINANGQTHPAKVFSPDLATLSILLDNNEAKLSYETADSKITYVDRQWDESSRTVKETIKEVTNYTTISGSNNEELTLTPGKWYVVKGTDVKRKWLLVPEDGTVNLILCDGAKLTSLVAFHRGIDEDPYGTLNIYGQAGDSGQLVADASSSGQDISDCAGIGGIDAALPQSDDNLIDQNCGILNIFGGKITARGGDLAAGIGGGDGGDGGTITIYGGDVYADGGDDAAGIGGGEGGSGGTLTVYGGTVFADGTGWGAGIGAGEDGKAGAVYIYGGTVKAWAGDDAGSDGGCAIGRSEGDDGNGTLTLGKNMMVKAGNSPSSRELFKTELRKAACFYRRYAEISPCDHGGSTTYIVGEGTHSLRCLYCEGIDNEPHKMENNKCTVCGYANTVYTVSIYLPAKADGSFTGIYNPTPETRDVVAGADIVLPTPPAEYIPAEAAFAGWVVGTPTADESYVLTSGDTEPLAAGTSYVVDGHVSIKARYIENHIVLANDADNSNTLIQNDGKTVASVKLAGRTLMKDGNWNTICLPFEVVIAGSPLDGGGVDVRELKSSSWAETDGVLTLTFSRKDEVKTLEAGKPYLIKWDSGENLTEEDLVFRNKVISASKKRVETGWIEFIGTYSPFHLRHFDGPLNTELYMGANNRLCYPTTDDFMVNSFRGYFSLIHLLYADKDGIRSSAGTNGSRANQVELIFGDETSGITEAEASSSFSTPHSSLQEEWYTLDGRRLNGKPTQKGVYIYNDKKIIIK